MYAQSKLRFEGFVAAGNAMSHYADILCIVMRLRQACDHPFLVLARAAAASAAARRAGAGAAAAAAEARAVGDGEAAGFDDEAAAASKEAEVGGGIASGLMRRFLAASGAAGSSVACLPTYARADMLFHVDRPLNICVSRCVGTRATCWRVCAWRASRTANAPCVWAPRCVCVLGGGGGGVAVTAAPVGC